MIHSLKPCQIMTHLASRWEFYFGLTLVTTVPFFCPNLANAQSTITVSNEQSLTIKTLLYINPEPGDNSLGEVRARSPFQTITQVPVSVPSNSPSPSSRQIPQMSSITISITSPSGQWENDNNFETPRKTLSEILVIEPNLDPETYTPAYVRVNPRDIGASATTTQTVPENSYRVMVKTENPQQEDKVRSLVPGAFRTNYNGQTVIQVGLFSSRENAEQVLNTLNGKGLKGVIVPL